jgi:hypothetical protein
MCKFMTAAKQRVELKVEKKLTTVMCTRAKINLDKSLKKHPDPQGITTSLSSANIAF